MLVQPEDNVLRLCPFDGQMFLATIDQPARTQWAPGKDHSLMPDFDSLFVGLDTREAAANNPRHGKSLLVESVESVERCYIV
jgi:hypothetical protein